MARYQFLTILLLSFSLSISYTSTASEDLSDKVFVAVSDPFPPYVIVNEENSTVSGVAVDQVKEAFQRANLKLKLINKPWKRALSDMQVGEADLIFTIFKLSERSNYILFSNEVLGISKLVLMTTANSDITYDGNIDTLKGDVIGVPMGYNAGADLEKAFTNNLVSKLEVPRIIEGLRMLMANRVNIISDNEDVLVHHAIVMGIRPQVRILQPPLNATPFHIGYSKERPHAERLKSAIDNELKKMKTEGRIKEIYQRYNLML